MATGRSTRLTGAVGEFLVAAELCRRDLIATPFSGNVPHYDIVASDEHGGHLVIQVKAVTKASWQLDVSKFVCITMDGNKQVLGTLLDEPFPYLYCVFVELGDSHSDDRYYVFSWKALQSVVVQHHREYLAKFGGTRPKNPTSTHCSIKACQLTPYLDGWDCIGQAMIESRRT